MTPEFLDFLEIAICELKKEDIDLRREISGSARGYPSSNSLN